MNIIKWSFKQLSVIGGLSMLPVLLFSQDTAKAYLDGASSYSEIP